MKKNSRDLGPDQSHSSTAFYIVQNNIKEHKQKERLIMKIEIKKKPNSPITEDIGEIELADFTIFAGMNNSGKTKLIQSIKNELLLKGAHVIEIPAGKVVPDNELKTTAQGDPLRVTLAELLDVAFDSSSISSVAKDLDQILPKEFASFGVENTELVVKTNAPSNEEYEKAIKEQYVKKFIDSVVTSDGYCNKQDVKLSETGQGTQRLVIAALLKYLGEKKNVKLAKEITYIIFEEPEIYLHPKLKKSLFTALSNLSAGSDGKIKVIITTHDPYFIELGRGYRVYQVFRNPDKNYSTDVSMVKDSKQSVHGSSAEVNYLVFGLVSNTYFIELYEKLKAIFREKNVNSISRCPSCSRDESVYALLDKWIVSQSKEIPGILLNGDKPKITELRHKLAHSTDRVDIPDSKLEESIVQVQALLEVIS